MKKVQVLALSTLVLLTALRGYASGSQSMTAAEKSSLTIQSVTFKEVVPTEAELYADSLNPPPANPANTAIKNTANTDFSIADLSSMVAIGEKIFDLIKGGQPVVTINRQLVSIVPKGVTDWTQLAGWQAPTTKVFELAVQNMYGVTTVSMRLKVTANMGGSYKGKGKYLANINMVPTSIAVAWGYDVDVSVSADTPVNTGTAANPVAGVSVDLSYNIHTLVVNVSGDQDYWLTGAGVMQQTQ